MNSSESSKWLGLAQGLGLAWEQKANESGVEVL